MTFANPGFLFLFILLVPYVLWYFLVGRKKEVTIKVADTTAYRYIRHGLRVHLVHLPMLLRLFTFAMFILALSRPQTSRNWQNTETEGIDVMIVMDISTSMLAEDLKPNRMEASKKVAQAFIAERPNDNIGLSVFAGEAFTQCPLTTDHPVLLKLLTNTGCMLAQTGVIQDGTAIGMGVANAVLRLQNSQAKSKVIILVTDGENNRGDISPIMGAELAKKMGIRMYTIGVGSDGSAPYPVRFGDEVTYINMPTKLDEPTLSEMAQMTGGKFFRATNNRKLEAIYDEIDQMEKTKLNVTRHSSRYEAFFIFGLLAMLSLLAEIILRQTWLRRLP